MDPTTESIQPDIPLVPLNTPANTSSNKPNIELDIKIEALRKAGKSFREIAKELCCSVGMVQRSLHRTVRAQAKQLGLTINRNEISAAILNHAPNAVSALRRALDDSKTENQLRAADSILDRAGFAPVQKVAASIHIIDEMSRSEKLAFLKSMMIEQGILKPTLDITPIDTSTNVNTDT